VRIAVYAGAANGENPKYIADAKRLGKWIAENGHTLVYGAGQVGMMGAIADTVAEYHGEIIGVIPEFLYGLYSSHRGITELVVTKDMSERKVVMSEKSDAAIALPGGSGTIEEITEAFSWSRLFVKRKPCILFNTDHFYDGLYEFYRKMTREAYLEKEAMDELLLTDDIDRIERFIEEFDVMRERG